MLLLLRSLLVSTVVAVATLPSHAQDSSSADQIVAVGLAALGQIDRGDMASLWEGASAVVKSKVPKAEFASDMGRARDTVGTVKLRTWAGVSRIRYEQETTELPKGLYANVDYSTQLTDGRTVFEKVSLRLEPDGWRFVGYVPRQQQ